MISALEKVNGQVQAANVNLLRKSQNDGTGKPNSADASKDFEPVTVSSLDTTSFSTSATGIVSVKTGSGGLATESYVNTEINSRINGLNFKQSCQIATKTNIDLSTTMAGSTIDSVVLVQDYRLLVKDQDEPIDNGIYIVNTGTGLTRASDFVGIVSGGDFVFVDGGADNGESGFVVVEDFGRTVGSDPIEFTKFTMSNVTTFANDLLADTNATEAQTTLGLTPGSGTNNILQAGETLIHGDFLKMDSNGKVEGRTQAETRGDIGITFGAGVGNILPNGEALTDGDFLKVNGTGADAKMIGLTAAETIADIGITLGSDAGNILQIDGTTGYSLTNGQLLKVDGGKMKDIAIGSTEGTIPQVGTTHLTSEQFIKVDASGKLASVTSDILASQIGAVKILSSELTFTTTTAGGTNAITLTVPTGYIATKIGYYVTTGVSLTDPAARFSLQIGNDSQDDRYLTAKDIISGATLPAGQFEEFHLSFPFVAAGTSELQLKNKIDGNYAEPGFTFNNMTTAARVEGKKFKLIFKNGSAGGPNSDLNTSTVGKLQVYLEIIRIQQ